MFLSILKRYWTRLDLRFIINHDTNKFGPLHRFSFSSQVQRNRDGQTSCRVSCRRLAHLVLVYFPEIQAGIVIQNGLSLLRSFPLKLHRF